MHYYVSIPALDHKIFKYAGHQSNDITSYDWYAEHGITSSESEIADGPYLVKAYVKYLGDRIDEHGEPYGEPSDFIPKQYVITARLGDTVICDMHVARSYPGHDEKYRVRAMVPGRMLHTFPVGKRLARTIAIGWHIEIALAQKGLTERVAKWRQDQ